MTRADAKRKVEVLAMSVTDAADAQDSGDDCRCRNAVQVAKAVRLEVEAAGYSIKELLQELENDYGNNTN